jgi:hypothetical protein
VAFASFVDLDVEQRFDARLNFVVSIRACQALHSLAIEEEERVEARRKELVDAVLRRSERLGLAVRANAPKGRLRGCSLERGSVRSPVGDHGALGDEGFAARPEAKASGDFHGLVWSDFAERPFVCQTLRGFEIWRRLSVQAPDERVEKSGLSGAIVPVDDCDIPLRVTVRKDDLLVSAELAEVPNAKV